MNYFLVSNILKQICKLVSCYPFYMLLLTSVVIIILFAVIVQLAKNKMDYNKNAESYRNANEHLLLVQEKLKTDYNNANNNFAKEKKQLEYELESYRNANEHLLLVQEKLKTDYNNANNNLAIERKRYEEANSLISEQTSEINTLRTHNDALSCQIDSLSENQLTSNNKIEILEKSQIDLKEELLSYKNFQKGIETKVEKLELNNQLLKNQNNELNCNYSNASKELERKSSELLSANDIIISLKNRLNNEPDVSKLKEELEYNIRMLQENTSKLDAKEKALIESELLANSRGEKISQLQAELRETKNQLEQLKLATSSVSIKEDDELQFVACPEDGLKEDAQEKNEEKPQQERSLSGSQVPLPDAEQPKDSLSEDNDFIVQTVQHEHPTSCDIEIKESEDSFVSSKEEECSQEISTVTLPNSTEVEPAPEPENQVKTHHIKLTSKRFVTKDKIENEDVDLPVIEKNTGIVKRSILQVIDVEKEGEELIDSDAFFAGEPEYIEHVARMLAEASETGREAYVCACCRQPVKISKRDFGTKEVLFFSHCKRDIYCEWRQENNRSGKHVSLNNNGIFEEGEPYDAKEKFRKIKELIINSLKSENSQKIGIRNVEEGKRIRSNYEFLYPRVACIYAKYNDKDFIFELQTRDVLMNTVVNKDIFYRLHYQNVIWIFGADEESGYDYIIKHVSKNTLFSNKRNVFIIDKETMEACVDRKELVLKCNYLDPDNKWHYRKETTGNNGQLITLEDLQLDEEMCKPYYVDANKSYFSINPNAETEYLDSIVSREKLLQDLKSNYEGKKAERRKLQRIVITETGYPDRFYYYNNGKTGIVNKLRMFIIPQNYDKIETWTEGKYRVMVIDRWGIIDENNNVIVDIKFLSISSLTSGKALVRTATESYYIDENGKRIPDESVTLPNGWKKVKEGSKWGILDKNGEIIVECIYDEIGSFRSRLIGLRNGSFMKLDRKYEYGLKIGCMCTENINNRGVYNINGVTLKDDKKKEATIGCFYADKSIVNISFKNVTLYIRDISNEQTLKKCDHIDNDSDFALNEILTGIITKVKNNKRFIKFEDNRVSYFTKSTLSKAERDPKDYFVGVSLTLQKVGFDNDVERTEWKFVK